MNGQCLIVGNSHGSFSKESNLSYSVMSARVVIDGDIVLPIPL